MIYIGTPSYRDSEIIPTIKDCLAKAKYPNDIRWGIFLQGDEGTEFKYDDRFRVMHCAWQEARGLGYARAQIQTMYEGEEFYLQTDSHHHFAEGWDVSLIEMLEQTSDPKPVLGSYAAVYDPADRSKPLDPAPFKMVAQEFTPYGTVKFQPAYMKDWKELNAPAPARFCSGHMTFTLGKWLEEYAFDPEIFFAGEEISMAIRSFTMGWSLWHPHKTVIWHEYLRTHRQKVWSDHTNKARDEGQVEVNWGKRQEIGAKRIRKLLREENNEEDLGIFDLGTVRSHRDYELWCGVNFAERTLTREAMNGDTPPTNKDGTEPDENLLDTYVAFEDRKGKVLEKRFWKPGEEPFKLVVWPRLKDGSWGKRRDFKIKD